VQDRLRIFDLGARDGLDRRWEPFHDSIEVLAFEPDREECERLELEAGSLGYPCRFVPEAVGRETKDDVVFHVARWPVASGLYPPNLDFLSGFPYAPSLLGVVDERRIATIALDDLCRRESVWPDYLKLDVEGAELDVLLGGEEALRRTLVLDVEVEFEPIRIGQPLFFEVDGHLRDRSWRLIGLRRIHWNGHEGERLIQGDALYCNAAALAAGLSPAGAAKLDVILTAYGKPKPHASRAESAPTSR